MVYSIRSGRAATTRKPDASRTARARARDLERRNMRQAKRTSVPLDLVALERELHGMEVNR